MSDFINQPHLILASGSINRAKLLTQAGLHFDVIPSGLDEDLIKNQHDGESFAKLAIKLSDAKAEKVSLNHKQSYVIAADQLCVYNNKIFDKPLSVQRAISQLTALQNQAHELISAVSLFKNGEMIWSHAETVQLKMRALSSKQIQHYVEIERPLQSCGSYHFEGRGQWLFEAVSSDTATVVGIPMLALMNQLIKLKLVEVF